MQKIPFTQRRVFSILAIGVLLGVLLGAGLRFLAYQPDTVHYHANFAVFVNGERLHFKEYSFYEEVSQCSSGEETPSQRVHMHQPESDVVHVHRKAVTWGQFFENLGFSVGQNHLATRDRVYADTSDRPLTFILNGKKVHNIASRVIGDEDKLLISYGSANEAKLEKEFQAIKDTAHRYNATADPAACSGNENPSWRERFQHLLN